MAAVRDDTENAATRLPVLKKSGEKKTVKRVNFKIRVWVCVCVCRVLNIGPPQTRRDKFRPGQTLRTRRGGWRPKTIYTEPADSTSSLL